MAKGTWKLKYRWEVRQVGDAGALLAAAGYAVAGQVTGIGVVEDITSYDQAITQAVSFCRQVQKLGIDAHWNVFQQPKGADATNPIVGLATASGGYEDATGEQEIAQGDTPEKGLRQRISAANREVSSIVAPGGDIKEDLTGTAEGV